jgi:hypothetical protein
MSATLNLAKSLQQKIISVVFISAKFILEIFFKQKIFQRNFFEKKSKF